MSSLKDDFSPIVYEFPEMEEDIFKTKLNAKFSNNIDYPNFSLGFHHYIHQSKDKMEITKDFEGKKKVYYVINKFEHQVDNYENSIKNKTETFLKLNPSPLILSRAFYKLWEMFFMFDLVPTDKDQFVSAHLAEGPGSFIQATMQYRDTYATKLSSKDKFYAITLHSEEKHVPPMAKSFINFYEKEKPQRFFQHKTHSKVKIGGSKTKTNGDLTDLRTIKIFGGAMKEKAHLVTADGGFNWKHENTQEQEAFRLIIGQIVGALNVQEKGGSFVLKLFESFTDTTSKLIYILSHFYKKVYGVKPLMSRKSNSEKYIICKGFKASESRIKIMEKLLDLAHKNDKLNLISIFDEFMLPKKFKNTLIKMNTDIANRQFQSINEMITFINGQNYYGDEYQSRRKMQIEANEYWNSTFLIDSKNLPKARLNVKEKRNKLIEENKERVKTISNVIV
ncbi:MAG: hypothetical protein CMF62_02760 [Magnetococcales bacterium]|nr:hypothetical protein [Magnetococcales bacterium]|tara:strand:+ start:35192 stop:36538 length:1347 start_codon:yes stop_codon:yes gene_type:complete